MRFAKTLLAAGFLVAGTASALAWPATVTSSANVRSGPGTRYPIVTTLPAGTTVDVSSCPAGWCRTQDGYIAASLLAQGGGTSVVVQPYANNYYDDYYDDGFYDGGWVGGGYWGPGWGPGRRWWWNNHRPPNWHGRPPHWGGKPPHWGGKPPGGKPPQWGGGGRPPKWVAGPGGGPRPGGWSGNRTPRMSYGGGGPGFSSSARMGGGPMIYRPSGGGFGGGRMGGGGMGGGGRFR